MAVYHRRSCEEGRGLLDVLLHRFPEGLDPIAVMVLAGMSAMRAGCRPFCPEPPAEPAPPLPGGVLHCGLDNPPAGYLASRIRSHHARHTCAFASGAASSLAQLSGEKPVQPDPGQDRTHHKPHIDPFDHD